MALIHGPFYAKNAAFVSPGQVENGLPWVKK